MELWAEEPVRHVLRSEELHGYAGQVGLDRAAKRISALMARHQIAPLSHDTQPLRLERSLVQLSWARGTTLRGAGLTRIQTPAPMCVQLFVTCMGVWFIYMVRVLPI